jgi:hypothetical protein
VLEGEVADQICRDLIAARDADGRHNVPMNALALGLPVLTQPEPAPVYRRLPMGSLVSQAFHTRGALLAGRVFVWWSFNLAGANLALPPRHLSLPLSVGRKIDGTVSCVTS